MKEAKAMAEALGQHPNILSFITDAITEGKFCQIIVFINKCVCTLTLIGLKSFLLLLPGQVRYEWGSVQPKFSFIHTSSIIMEYH